MSTDNSNMNYSNQTLQTQEMFSIIKFSALKGENHHQSTRFPIEISVFFSGLNFFYHLWVFKEN